ncbi:MULTISPECIES: winged helix-turn-helix transcriptional regulator [Streptomyces]|uniref:Winged helix-turn-helix transcriptional regulator n=1 Tax=Streptomyces doudnae TaxID=3075536 RepID=A0ABD5EWS1_9ACTN|nr:MULTISPECIES: winged helix-turn-helix transcriptional regulator [unclassified Streptomyces]MDT0439201.1 winged helix-turn-helix transcriptional regulator [Streptomyces sp. DSM 41981]MYQ65779.1 redoxin domain-containing protein [Streptomyces sp. SID4950]SCE07557.1 transcriptional regulator, HxlR family [Streptomyces sp. SolWspMP-5a-2]
MKMHNADETCGTAQAAMVLGDWWNVLVLREVARGHVRFDALAAEIGLSRKVLSERLGRLVAHGVLNRSLYQRRPVRYEYLFTEAGTALLPLLAAMQDWGDRWVLGDGDPGAAVADGGAVHARVHALTGTRVPDGLTLPGPGGEDVPVVTSDASATVLFTFPGADPDEPADDPDGPDPERADRAPDGPDREGADPAPENRLFRDAWPAARARGVRIVGVSTQLPHEQRALVRAGALPHPLLSDAGHVLTTALRLPASRSAGRLRLTRLILVVDAARTVRHVLFPVDDIEGAVARSLRLAEACARPA